MAAAAAAVVFALVAALPLSLPVVRPGPLPPVATVTASSPLMFVFLRGKVERAALPLSLALPLPFSLPLHFGGGRAGSRAGMRALLLVSRPPAAAAATTVAVATARLGGVAVAMVAGLGLEVGEEGRGRVSPRRWTATVRAGT